MAQRLQYSNRCKPTPRCRLVRTSPVLEWFQAWGFAGGGYVLPENPSKGGNLDAQDYTKTRGKFAPACSKRPRSPLSMGRPLPGNCRADQLPRIGLVCLHARGNFSHIRGSGAGPKTGPAVGLAASPPQCEAPSRLRQGTSPLDIQRSGVEDSTGGQTAPDSTV